MAEDKQPKITYRVDDMEYDVLKLSEEAQGIYYALLATQSELNTLGKRSIVLKAAITELNNQLQPFLTNDVIYQPESQYPPVVGGKVDNH